MILIKDLSDFVGTSEDTCCRTITAIAEVPTESAPRSVSEQAAKAFLTYWTLTRQGIQADYAKTIIKLLSSCLDGARGVVIADGRYVVAGPEDRVFDLIESRYVNRTEKAVTLLVVFGPEIWKRFRREF